MTGPLLKTLLFTLVAPGTVLVLVPRWLLGSRAADVRDWSAASSVLAIALMAIGVSLYAWCALDFATVGRGTPAPIDPPRNLVMRGPYRFVRNPMYIGVGAVLLGEALWFGSAAILWYVAAFSVCVSLFVLLVEEPMLRRKFGEEYRRYCASVPRWPVLFN